MAARKKAQTLKKMREKLEHDKDLDTHRRLVRIEKVLNEIAERFGITKGRNGKSAKEGD